MRKALHIAGLATLLLWPLAATAGEQRGAKVSVDFKDAPVAEVVGALEELAGRPVVTSPVLRADNVTLAVSEQPLERVLDQVLQPLGYTWQFSGTALEATGITAGTYLVVERVEPGSAAERAGLRKGDIVTEINGFSVRDRIAASNALAKGSKEGRAMRVVRKADPAQVVEVKVER